MSHIFKAVFDEHLQLLFPIIKQNFSDNINNFFSQFPRTIPLYGRMILKLVELEKDNFETISPTINNAFCEILKDGKSSLFDVFQNYMVDYKKLYREALIDKFIRIFELLLLTDFLCILLSEQTNIKESDANDIIKHGLDIVNNYVSPEDYILIIKQYSVIYSFISKLTPSVFVEKCQIQSAASFFVLMRFVRLDFLGNKNADELVGKMKEQLKLMRSQRISELGLDNYNLPQEVFESLSTFLLTYEGNDLEKLKYFYDVANEVIDRNPGAIVLITKLMPKLNIPQEEVNKFYQEKVYTSAQKEDGIVPAVRALRCLMFKNKLDPKYLFWEWIPKGKTDISYFLEIIKGKIDQSGESSFTSVFIKYYLNSPYYHKCPTLMRDVLIHLAAMDFKTFLNSIVPKYQEMEIESEPSLVFLRTIPIINEPEFKKNIDEKMICELNGIVSEIINKKLKELETTKTYGISIDLLKKYNDKVDKSSDVVSKVYNNWGVNTGKQCSNIIKSTNDPIYSQNTSGFSSSNTIKFVSTNLSYQRSMNASVRIVRIIPIMLNSQESNMKNWIISLIKFSANLNSEISKLSYQTCQTLLQDHEQNELFNKFIEVLVDMITSEQSMEIIYISLSLLIFGVKQMEPGMLNSIKYDIEFCALLCMCSSNPIIRIISFKLLSKVNKILTNKGLHSQIEDHLNAILSNAKQNILLQEFPKRPNHPEHKEDDLILDNVLSSKFPDPWYFYLAEIGKTIVSTNYKSLISRLQNIAIKFKFGTEYNHFDLGVLSLLFAIFKKEDFQFDNPEKNWFDNIFDQVKSDENDFKLNFLITSMRHANYSIVPILIKKMVKINIRFLDILPSLYLMLCTIKGNSDISTTVAYNTIKLLSFLNEKNDKYGLYPKNNSEIVKKIPEIELLNFFNCLILCLDALNSKKKEASSLKKSSGISGDLVGFFVLANNLCFGIDVSLFKEVQTDTLQKIQEYASAALVSIIESGELIKIVQKNKKFLHKFKQCELHGYHVLFPLLKNNSDQCFSEFINKSFTSKHSDLFMNAIFKLSKQKEIFGNLLFEHAGEIFLLCQYRIKTGSLIAQNFLEEFILFYAHKIGDKDAQLKQENTKTELIPCIHFQRVAEDVVSKGLSLMMEKFKVSLKVLIDVLIPWISIFRLRNSRMCVPTVNTMGKRLLPSQFLQNLIEITKNANPHDFSRIASIWSCLYEIEVHKQLITTCILERANIDIKRRLFEFLYEKFPEEISRFLVKQCEFSFYAYTTYQRKSDFETEFWITPVLVKIIKNDQTYFENFLPIIAQFALLFHSNQTQTLLKTLCQKLKVSYNRRTLSISSIRQIVDKLKSAFKTRFSGDKKQLEKNMYEWILESMRWSIGSNNLRIAYTSLIILNVLDNQECQYFDKDTILSLLYGLCKSCSYFLSCVDKDDEKGKTQTYDFINETFILFGKHFDGNELLCLNYLKTYLPFVVSVDAYFNEILPLYLKCLNSVKVKDQALDYILQVLKPCFNELESDSKTRKTFDECVQMPDVILWKNDLLFVDAVLQKNNDINELISKATNAQLNRALNHYSLMIQTASVDLKRRIFENSSIILQYMMKIQNEHRTNRKNIQMYYLHKSREFSNSPTSISNIETQARMELIKQEEAMKHEQIEQSNEADGELNKQSLLNIFQESIKMLPEMEEALSFIQSISLFDPLIPTIPVIDEQSWAFAAKAVISELEKLDERKTNTSVTLTDCVNLNSTSNLLDPENSPKILPFSSFHEFLTDVMGDEEDQNRSANWFDRISIKFFTLGVEIQSKLSEKIESNTSTTTKADHFEKLPLNMCILQDSQNRAKPKTDYLCSNEEFLKILPVNLLTNEQYSINVL